MLEDTVPTKAIHMHAKTSQHHMWAHRPTQISTLNEPSLYPWLDGQGV